MHDVTISEIQSAIITLPNRPPAMLASHVAGIYQVKTKRVNEAVARNPERFPDDFVFKATEDEAKTLRSQNATVNVAPGGHLPWMFTRFGANMLSAVLKSDVAARRSVQIMRAFSTMEEAASGNRAGGTGQAVETLFGRKGVFAHKEISELPAEYVPAVRKLVADTQAQAAKAGMNMVTSLAKSSLPGDFIDKLIIYRKRGNTQKETAKLLDVSKDAVQRYEKLAFKMGMIEKDRRGKVVA